MASRWSFAGAGVDSEVFSAKKGHTKYNMQDIFAGKFCGACHAKVAFPFYDCQLCHLKEVY